MTALPTWLRIKKRADFCAFYRKPAVVFKTTHFVFLQQHQPVSRLGVVVKKKTFKSAVRRNYLKRVIKSLFYRDMDQLNKMDLIVVSRKPIKLDFNHIEKEWNVFVQNH